MKHYFFSETISGEPFLVGADDEVDAIIIAEDVAAKIGHQWNNGEWQLGCHGEVTEEEAENSGLDEY